MSPGCTSSRKAMALSRFTRSKSSRSGPVRSGSPVPWIRLWIRLGELEERRLPAPNHGPLRPHPEIPEYPHARREHFSHATTRSGGAHHPEGSPAQSRGHCSSLGPELGSGGSQVGNGLIVLHTMPHAYLHQLQRRSRHFHERSSASARVFAALTTCPSRAGMIASPLRANQSLVFRGWVRST